MISGPLYELRRVRQRYGETVAVDVATLEVPQGEILGLLGPTGAGKSTLLRLLAGLEKPVAGDIKFAGSSLCNQPLAVRRRITLVFQRPILLAGTVRENVEYGLRIRGEKTVTVREQTDEMVQRLKIGHLAGKSSDSLSGGQTQLVALARALVLRPDVLLLDEPTSNLDPANVALVESVIQDEFQQRPLCVVWGTHNLFQSRRVAGRLALMLEGRIIEIAATEPFFNAPRDSRTRDFIDGKMIY